MAGDGYRGFRPIPKRVEVVGPREQGVNYIGMALVYQDEYEKMVFPDEPSEGHGSKVGYLVVPRKLSLKEWEEKYG